MNEQILKQPTIVSAEKKASPKNDLFMSYLPVVLVIFGSLLMLAARLSIGGERFISDGAAMMLALASYLIAAVFYLTNLYAPFRFAENLGLWAAAFGVFWNLSS